MTNAGITLGIVVGLILLVWVFSLIRRDRLYVGYGVIFVVGTIAALAVLIVRPLLDAVAAASEALLPMASLSRVALLIMLFLLVYVFTQITVLSNRSAILTRKRTPETRPSQCGPRPRRRASDPAVPARRRVSRIWARGSARA